MNKKKKNSCATQKTSQECANRDYNGVELSDEALSGVVGGAVDTLQILSSSYTMSTKDFEDQGGVEGVTKLLKGLYGNHISIGDLFDDGSTVTFSMSYGTSGSVFGSGSSAGGLIDALKQKV